MLFKQFTQLNKLNTLRQFATQASLTQFNPATLHLKSGQSFTGRAFGADKSSFGETVFTTSVTSYTESMTDPSYKGQLLVFTTPLIGNYGVPNNPSGNQGQYTPEMMLESSGIQCSGVVVADVAEKFSHYEAVESLHEWCKRHNIPGITGVDTRAITTILRDQGTTLGQIAVGGAHEKAPEEYFDPSPINLIAEASTKSPYTLNEKGDVHVAVMDFGSKANIIRSLLKRDAKVTVLPWDYDFYSNRDKFDALFLSNGPGDPRHASIAVENLKKTVSEYTKPIFGICMGHQLLGLAAGLEAYRMTFGNRGHNQPVLALGSSGSIKQGRVYVTSQNHQYALKLEEQFPDGWEPFFINCNDSSVEGIKSSEESGKKIWGVQFHPEAYGGPLDTIDMFTDFVDAAKKMKAQ